MALTTPPAPMLTPSTTVTLRRVQAGDVPMILAMESDPAVMQHSTGVKPATEARRQELLAWLAEPQTDIGHWSIVVGQVAVGWISLVPLEYSGRLQLAYRLSRAAWGHGYATLAGKLLCDYAWRTLDVPQLVAVVWPGNHASGRVLEKLGFVFSAQEQHYHRDTNVYVLPRPNALSS
ncbi:GNAT family N-acetyltransferase [Achromobacter kerstersii]